MGKVLSIAVGKAKRFNVENRAQRVISQEKPTPAPKYDANVKDLQRILEQHPEIVDEVNRKSAELDDRLKKVFVTSSEYVDQRRIINPEKPLPVNRKYVEDFEFGFKEPEPEKVALGKCTLRQAIQFLSDHQLDGGKWTAEKIAQEFKLKQDNVQNILDHFHMFNIHISKKEGKAKKYLLDDYRERSGKIDETLKGTRKF
ncbi:CLUMA_CG000748, isoform A [Clunio marinus]|uniref:CLUMA_CG000748, isoform A n=1 Tax=Clunio marinus TaxID=568069 RepID=A0A1J1HG16_9DIPT|nr:CLUMA_CG000748, isoform A [Clunio marinus]